MASLSLYGLLPVLEVEKSYAKGVQKCKEEREANQYCSHLPHEIWIKPKMVFYIPFNCRIRHNPWSFNSVFNISILGNNEPIHSPCYWANPIVPHPPLGDFLKIQKIIKYYQTSLLLLSHVGNSNKNNNSNVLVLG